MSTLHVSNKTHPGVLLQPQALEDAVADNQQGTDETGRIALAPHGVGEAGVQHGRGETRFPRLNYTRSKAHYGFQTGDLVRAVVPKGKKQGTHTGRVAVRATGSFNVTTTAGTIQGVSHKHCTVLQRGDGYGYLWKEDGAFLPALKDRASSAEIS